MLEISIIPTKGTTELKFDPCLDEIKRMLQEVFHDIIEVNHDLPRVDKVMFPGKTN